MRRPPRRCEAVRVFRPIALAPGRAVARSHRGGVLSRRLHAGPVRAAGPRHRRLRDLSRPTRATADDAAMLFTRRWRLASRASRRNWSVSGASSVPAAIALWLVLALWIALFVVLTHLALVRLGMKRAALLVPFLWTGLEYFRSELYLSEILVAERGVCVCGIVVLPWSILECIGIGFRHWLCAALCSLAVAARRVLTRTRFGVLIMRGNCPHLVDSRAACVRYPPNLRSCWRPTGISGPG